jgi:hypothetical protein
MFVLLPAVCTVARVQVHREFSVMIWSVRLLSHVVLAPQVSVSRWIRWH